MARMRKSLYRHSISVLESLFGSCPSSSKLADLSKKKFQTCNYI